MDSPYRTSEVTPAPPPRKVFRGPDDARYSLAVWLILLIPITPWLADRHGISDSLAFGLLGAAMFAVALVDRRTRRYSLHITRSGLLLRRCRLWFVPTRVQRFSLEWDVDEDEDWHRGTIGGYMIAPPRRYLQQERAYFEHFTTFGPSEDTPSFKATLAQMSAALRHARELVSSTDTHREIDPRSGDVAALWDRVDLSSITRGPWGRVASMRLTRGALLDALRLPPGTVVEFDFSKEWQSPRTPDRVTRVTLGGVAAWSNLPTLLRPGARIDLDARRHIRKLEGAFEGSVTLQGIEVDGRAAIGFDRKGVLRACSLARDLSWTSLHLPAGTCVRRAHGSWMTFEGPGIRLTNEPDAHPTSVNVTLFRRNRRTALAELLTSPEGKVKHAWAHEPTPDNQRRRHWSVPLD